MTHRLACLAVIAGLIGCSGTTATEPTPDSPRPYDATLSAGLVISAPIAAVISGGDGKGDIVVGSTVYVSLLPGTAPHGRSATITNLRTGAEANAQVTDGGFDPVPLPAQAGDSIGLMVVLDAGGPIGTTRTVAASQAPRVVRSDPAKVQADVPVNAELTVVFSEPVVPASVSANSVVLVGGGESVTGAIKVIGNSGSTVQFVPDHLLRPETAYALRLEPGLTGISGNHLAAALTVEFTTSNMVPPEPVASVRVLPDSITVLFGATQRLGVVVKGSTGDTLEGRRVQWSSENTAVAAVSNDGTVTGVAGGTTTIFANCEGIVASSRVFVDGPADPVVNMQVYPGQTQIMPGDTFYFQVDLIGRSGHRETDRQVSWTTSDAGIASVNAEGRLVGVSPGMAVITASVDGQTRSVMLIVKSPPDPTIYGSLHVTISTTGVDLDPDGYTLVVEGQSDYDWPIPTPVQPTDARSFIGLSSGQRKVWLTDIDPNCQVSEPTRTITVTAGQETQVAFNITCSGRNALPPNDSLAGVWQVVAFEFFNDQALTSRAAELIGGGMSAELIIGPGSSVQATWQWHTDAGNISPYTRQSNFTVFNGTVTAGPSSLAIQVLNSGIRGCGYFDCVPPLSNAEQFVLENGDLVLRSENPVVINNDFFDEYYWTRVTLRRVR